MYRYEDIRRLHVELTSRCNAACPQCGRFAGAGEVNEALPLTELTLADIVAMFPVEFLRQLEVAYLCGNYGDAMVARDTLRVLRHLREVQPTISLALHTNGSGQTGQFWRELAGLGVSVVFAIDGLADTNPIYRRNTSWSRIMESVDAFLGAGGRGIWAFIAFSHNEHQIEEAEALSRRLGFAEFRLKRTTRFGQRAKVPVLDRDGHRLYDLSPPRAATLQATPPTEEWREIACQAVKKRELYVSAEGLIFPCCFTAHVYGRSQASRQMAAFLDALPGGRSTLDARRRPLREILEGPLFQEALPESWNHPVDAGGVLVCQQKCGAPKRE
jgi:MoaA/NifB/PqqE/SkfB family radical SAM enzyme